MAVLEILHYPDPRLRVKAKPVGVIDDEIKQIVADMYETMYHANGVGLAATQVGIHQQIFVMDVSEKRDQPYCAINPKILEVEGVQQDLEGCLSVIGAYDRVKRATKVVFEALDLSGKSYQMTGIELMAACVQHELDHLNGMLFIDHLSRLKQDRIRTKLDKNQRRGT